MPARCSAPRCNSNKEGCCCTTFAQDPNWKQKWIDAVRIPNWKSLKLALLCEFALPYIHSKAEDKPNQSETISTYWLIEDIYTFENIGLSHTVGSVKYLACADCERGPVGWFDLSTKKSYIASCRVKYE